MESPPKAPSTSPWDEILFGRQWRGRAKSTRAGEAQESKQKSHLSVRENYVSDLAALHDLRVALPPRPVHPCPRKTRTMVGESNVQETAMSYILDGKYLTRTS